MSTPKAERSTGVLLLQTFVAVVILAVGVAGFLALSYGLQREPSQDEGSAELAAARVDVVRRHKAGLTIHADGVVVPYREVELSAQVSGRIVQRAEVCRAGHYVVAGQLLVQIDPQDYQLEVERSQEQLEQALVALDEWKEQLEGTARLMKFAERELELRTSELARLNAAQRTAFSLTDLERAEAAKLAAENALGTLRNKQLLLHVGQSRLQSVRELAEVAHQRALLDLERTRIVAPTSGVIVSDFIEEDSFVQVGTPLVLLEDTSKSEVKCKLQMQDLVWLWDQAGPYEPAAVAPAERPPRWAAT